MYATRKLQRRLKAYVLVFVGDIGVEEDMLKGT